VLAACAAVFGVACCVQASWIHVKAFAAQALIHAAWERNRSGATAARPWPWADTTPVAKLSILRDGAVASSLVVLEGANGRNLAFGPVHDGASALPGETGNSVIAAHRDTHFRLLRTLRLGEELRIERTDGRVVNYRVTDTRVVDSRKVRIALGGDHPRLTLVTCYPFDSIQPGGPLRFVVTADSSAAAGNPPPHRVAHAAAPLPVVTSDGMAREPRRR
jgi:sortase A